jgi:hypothetical protein
MRHKVEFGEMRGGWGAFEDETKDGKGRGSGFPRHVFVWERTRRLGK